MKLKSLLYEWENSDEGEVARAAKARGYIYRSFRGDRTYDEITVYSPKDRREHGIFTTPIRDVAATYARGDEPRLFYIRAPKLLNLMNDSIQNMKWVQEWAENWDDWIDRTSGEEMSAWDILSGGQMFDYEGDWSSDRWMDIQAHAENQGYDAIILPDYDSSYGIFPSFVVFDEKNLKLADTVTYSDQKQAIPLNSRFDTASDDIRY